MPRSDDLLDRFLLPHYTKLRQEWIVPNSSRINSYEMMAFPEDPFIGKFLSFRRPESTFLSIQRRVRFEAILGDRAAYPRNSAGIIYLAAEY